MLTIITAGVSRALTTFDAVKAELAMSDGTDDIFISSLVEQASAAVEGWCGHPLAAETVRETFDVRCSFAAPDLLLSRIPVTSVLSVTVDGSVLAEDRYEFDGEAGFLYALTSTASRGYWSPGRVAVEYAAGYVLPGQEGRTLPHDIERAAIIIARNAYASRGRDPTLRSDDVEGIGSQAFGLASTFTSEVAELLARYRAPGVA